MDCLFCKIAKKEIPSELTVYENDKAVAFLDMHPISSGHTLVVPKKHAENIIELSQDEVAPLFLVVKKVTEMLNVSLAPEGFTIGINHGRGAGQIVDHLHIHVIPRFKNDGGKSIHSIVFNPGTVPLLDLIKRIRMSKSDN